MIEAIHRLIEFYAKIFRRRSWRIVIALVLYVVVFMTVWQWLWIRGISRERADLEATVAALQTQLASTRAGGVVLAVPEEWEVDDYELPELDPEAENLYRSLLEFARYSISQGDYLTAQEKLDDARELADTVEVTYLLGFTAWGQGHPDRAKDAWLSVASFSDLSTVRRQDAVSLALQAELELGDYVTAVEIFEDFRWLLTP